MKHLIDTTDLSVGEINEIIDLALDIIANRSKYSDVCRGRKLATLFYEPSTRTRLSFTSAMMELGGNVIGFSDAASSSVSKGETVADTVRVISCFADIIAMRHFKEGAPLVASQYAGIPVINAGDGSHAHPTQTLTDLLTIRRELGRLDNFTIGFCGDLKFGRTVHSLIKALSRYTGIKVILIAPDELRLPSYLREEVCDRNGIPTREVKTMEEVMPELDILYMTRDDSAPPAAARQRDSARRGQRPACRLLPPGRERKVRAHGTHMQAARVVARTSDHTDTAPFGRLRSQRDALHEPQLHIDERRCRHALPTLGRRLVPLRLLRVQTQINTSGPGRLTGQLGRFAPARRNRNMRQNAISARILPLKARMFGRVLFGNFG